MALRKIRNGTRFIRFIFRDKPILLELSTARIIVGVLFVLFGSASVFNGFRQYKHFLPLAVKEAESMKQHKSINIVMLFMLLNFQNHICNKRRWYIKWVTLYMKM